MKRKLSISVEERTITLLEKLLEGGRFRNKSHIIEYSLNELFSQEGKNA